MSSLTMAVLLTLICVALGIYGLAVLSTLRHRRHQKPLPESALPPISLLKPVKGVEESLEQNLRSLYEQAYEAPMEMVFASTERDDPALAVARRVAADYPHVTSKFVLSDEHFGLNPKVANLSGALRAASHDWVLQSDANVQVAPDYLATLVREAQAHGANLSSSVVVGVGENSLGAALENLQLSACIGPSTCIALHVGGVHCVIGKSMLFRKQDLLRVGGLEGVRNILCEDFILGERYRAAGMKVMLSERTVVQNVNQDATVERFLARHSRWLKMRAVIHVGSFVADIFANPILWAVVLMLASGFAWWTLGLLFAVMGVKVAGDALLMRLTRGYGMPWYYLALAPLKDLVMAGVWVYAVFSRSVTWRGVNLRFGKHSELRYDEGNLAQRAVRRVLG